MLQQAAEFQMVSDAEGAAHAGQACVGIAGAGGACGALPVYEAVGDPVHHVKQLLCDGIWKDVWFTFCVFIIGPGAAKVKTLKTMRRIRKINRGTRPGHSPHPR